MTKIKVFRSNDFYTGFTTSGHSGFSNQGQDIVCAAISAITQTAILGLLEVANIEPIIKKKDGLLEISIPVEYQKKLDIFVILSTMLLGIRDLQKQFPKHISLEEVLI